MVKRLPCLVLATLVALAAASTSAEAALVITLERISDTQVRMIGTGSVGGPANVFDTLALEGGVGTGSGMGTSSGDFAIGGYGVDSWSTFFGSFLLISSGTFTESQSPTGSDFLSRTSGNFIFNAVGSNGELVGNIVGGNTTTQRVVGRWQIVAAPPPVPVPELSTVVPGSLGIVLVGLGAYRRRRMMNQG
jgi:hypothetical protein